MQQSAIGIITRTFALSETSLIVDWVTLEQGRIATVARGARRPKSPLRGKLDLFFCARFSFRRSARSELHLLQEVEVDRTHAALRLDLAALRRAAYASALIAQLTEKGAPIPGLFRLLDEFLKQGACAPDQPWPVILFELRVLADQGLAPDPAGFSPAARRLIGAVLASDPASHCAFQPSRAALDELSTLLERHLLHETGGVPKQRAAAVGVSSARRP